MFMAKLIIKRKTNAITQAVKPNVLTGFEIKYLF